MPQRQATKSYRAFVAGLHTDVTPLTFPENSVQEIENFRLNIDGSLSRRKGLEFETGSVFKDIDPAFDNGTSAVTEHFWRNAGGTDVHFHIIQVGANIIFYTDDRDVLGQRADVVDLLVHKAVNSVATNEQIAAEPVDISWGRGQALVTQKHLDPFFMEFDEATNTITTSLIQIEVRDFAGVEDGLVGNVTPFTSTPAHDYNLQNQGWPVQNITSFQGSQGVFPSRNMRWYQGLARTELGGGAGYDFDGVRVFDPLKIIAEPDSFGLDFSPSGHFLVDPFNTAVVRSTGSLEIATWSISGTSFGTETITVETVQPHGLGLFEDVSITGQQALVEVNTGGGDVTIPFTFDGIHDITAVPSANEFEFEIQFIDGFVQWIDQFQFLGTAQGGIANPDGEDLTVRPTTNAFFAGRAWYAGTPGGKVGQSVLFSQVIERNVQFGRCYQEADPTSEERPDITEADGGQIFIPEAGRVLKLQPFGPSMLVMCDNGVWEIDGGGNRYFDAIDFAVRRVTEIGCRATESVIEVESQIFYASDQGGIRIIQDPQARVLVAQNLTLEKINTKWNAIDRFHLEAMKALYDPIDNRLMWMYDTSASPTARTFNYTEILIYDLRLDAFYVTTFSEGSAFAEPTFIKSFVLPESENRNGDAIIKFLTWGDGNGGADNLRWAELTNDTDFTDLEELDAAAFFTTGFEAMDDPSKDKQIKKLTTFMTRIPDSSLTMRIRWDFAESGITGKFGPKQEAYRPPRLFLGTGQTQADDGYPVVFTKHDVPGQGLVAQLRFNSNPGADAEIIGWVVDFLGTQSQ